MGATEGLRSGGAALPAIEPFDAADLARHRTHVLALSEAAHWNQTAEDWQLLLAQGEGLAIWAEDDQGRRRLAASTVVLPYGDAFAWISMVLVLPPFRRRGYAAALLQHALQGLQRRGVAAVLDATPAGVPLYRQHGFVDAWSFTRYRRPAVGSAPVAGPPTATPPGVWVRPLQDGDWRAIDAHDRIVFGASRLTVLRELARRLPGAAWVAEARGQPCGLVLGRDGREAAQIGPLWACDAPTAQALLAAALGAVGGPVMVDLLDREVAVRAALLAQGFAAQRPFTRMVLGPGPAPGSGAGLVLVAGPELG